MESFRTSDGRALAYNVMGSGPPLVCHPGGPGFAGAELADLGGLDSNHTLVLLDPRGTGDSDPAGDYSLDGYAADLDELRVHLRLQRTDLLGFSHGAVVAIHYAAKYPDHLARLVLAGGLAAFTDEMKQFADDFIESKSDEPWHDDAVDALAEEENGEIDDLAGLWQREAPLYFSRWVESYCAAVGDGARGARGEPLREFTEKGFDVRPELSSVAAQTLIVCGRDDFICGPPAAEVLLKGIRDARLEMIERAGHMMHLEQPEAFRHAVAAFLSPEA
jgi:pimeloyl-ACP methyl ester carboxylesterase